MPTAINNRYILHESLGQGAMGVVHRATDRLSGEIIAIKRVTIPSGDLQFASQTQSDDDEEVRFALAQEFQTLASLRHPNIISVLDYGFDEIHQPYFTMNYLPDAKNILEAGQGQNTEKKVGLLIQVLQALAYLHRRGILHRDLKPGNVLVTESRARVLDFGLSVSREQASGRTGTLAYMAPETLQHGLATEASDLYAVGVIAYEMFAGVLPFEVIDIMGILSRPADTTKLEAPPELINVIERLLQKDPADRYESAYAAIVALDQAIGRPLPEEDPAIRESFLQAATFVGREKELSQLMKALEMTKQNHGSAWLIGSESGVGKTRLLEELRIRALVRGAQVLRGQAVEGQGQPYHLWQAPLRRLSLAVELSDLEAEVLKPIVPDIGPLLEKDFPDAPELDDKEAVQRLITTITNVIRKMALSTPPLILLLEDLHWALESLETLDSLGRTIADIPILVIGTYRTEEIPDLPDKLPTMQTMLLPRFDQETIAELSASMLGEAGIQSPVLTLLNEETEGNAFFLVETVRALAEEAGSLQEVGSATLPRAVFAGGVKRVIQRRLERVPVEYRPLLKSAAVAGRAIETDLLQTIFPETDLESWLTTCANVAVLEIHDERWRFAHDKLREALLSELGDAERQALHLQVANGLEKTYTDDLAAHFGRLTWHYAQAGDQSKELYYAKLAGEQAAAQFLNDEALNFLDRTLELLPDEDLSTRYEVLLTQEMIYSSQGKYEERQANLNALREIVLQLGDPAKDARTKLSWASYYFDRGDYPTSVNYAQETITLASELSEQALALEAYNRLATTLWRHNDFDQAEYYAQKGLELAQKNKDQKNEAMLLTSLGMIAFKKRDLVTAHAYFEQSLPIALKRNFLRIQANALNNLGMITGYQGNFQAAQNYYQQALSIVRKIGVRRQEGGILSNLGWIAGLLGEYKQALNYLDEGIRIAREINDPYDETYGLINISSYAGTLGDLEKARQAAEKALQLARKIGDRSAEAWAYTNLGHSYLSSHEYGKAAKIYQSALNIRNDLNQPLLATEPAAGLARSYLEQGDPATAQQYTQTVLPVIEQNKGLDGTDDPLRVYFNCYLVLEATQQSDGKRLLAAAHDLLQKRAAKIEDPATRNSFLQNIPHHQEIIKAWQKTRS